MTSWCDRNGQTLSLLLSSCRSSRILL
jgi:hypothetical protein